MAMINQLARIKVQLMLLLVFVVTILPLQAAGAKSPYPDGLIPAGETLQGSQFIFAPQINIAGTVDGDVFAFGQDVTLTGEIKGSLFVLSTTAAIEGQLEGDLYTATSRLTLEPTSNIGRSAYILAGIVNLLPGSQIGRDLYLIGLSGEVSSTVGRYQRTHLGIVEILDMLVGENGVLSPLLPPGFKLPWSGINNLAAQPVESAVHLFSATPGIGLSAVVLPLIFQPQIQSAAIDSAAIGTWLLERLRAIAPLFLIGLLLLWLFPRFFQGSTERLRSHPMTCLWIGVIVFFVGFGVAFLALALFVALGLFFAVLNYWDLAMMIWGAGLGGVSVGLALFGLVLGYLSKIMVAYVIGAILLNRLPVTFWGRRVWVLLLGLLLLVLLLGVPILGWVLSMLTIMLGLGAIYLQLRQRGQPAEEPEQDIARSTVVEEIEPQTEHSVESPGGEAPEEKMSEGATVTPSAFEDAGQTATEEIANTDAEMASNASAMAEQSDQTTPE